MASHYNSTSWELFNTSPTASYSPFSGSTTPNTSSNNNGNHNYGYSYTLNSSFSNNGNNTPHITQTSSFFPSSSRHSSFVESERPSLFSSRRSSLVDSGAAPGSHMAAGAGGVGGSVLDRFSNLGQITRDTELGRLNLDSTPIFNNIVGGSASRNSSVSLIDTFSPFVSPSLSYARSNSISVGSMWQTQQQTVPEPQEQPLPIGVRSPLYPSVFSSPANSISALSDNGNGNWPTDEFNSPSVTPASNGQPANRDRNLRQQIVQQHQHHQSTFPSPGIKFNSSTYKQEAHHSRSNSTSTNSNSTATPATNSHPKRNRNHSDNVNHNRSPLLEEFRTNRNFNKYDLKSILNDILEFSLDQYGSRFIQTHLTSATNEDKDAVFQRISGHIMSLSTDIFGNYIVQKFIEIGTDPQINVIVKQLEGNVLRLSMQMYGCRVVQKAIEHVGPSQQAVLIKEIDGYVLQCVKDQNGNHVIQKAIERIPAEHITFIIDAFQDQVYQLATHPYGCRVIQRMLEHCKEKPKRALLNELHKVVYDLVEDQYGNYVIQHVIERGSPDDKSKVMTIVRGSILSFSRHKFASNVVEKCIIFGTNVQRDELINEILRPQNTVTPLNLMIKDQYANYVIQKLLEVTEGTPLREKLVSAIKPILIQLKKFSYGKHLVSIEKLVMH